MAQISREVALLLIEQKRDWIGSPALLRVEPWHLAGAVLSRDLVVDGLTRLGAMRHLGIAISKQDYFVFRADKVRDDGLTELLPRLLVFAGHYDRAYEHTPELYRTCVSDLKTYLRVPPSEAYAVFANRHKQRKAFVRGVHRHDPVMGNRTVVRRIRQLLVTSDETGVPFDTEQLRRLLYDKSAYERRTTDDSDSLYNESAIVHDNS